MSTECNDLCNDCSYDFCVPASMAARPSKAAQRQGWRQDALFELEDLGDLYGIDMSQVRL